MPAKDLYISPLFRMARKYVERTCDDWYVLSAEYGVVSPNRVIEPYDKTLLKMKLAERKTWAAGVYASLERELRPGSIVFMYAGVRYREYVQPWLEAHGHTVKVPLESLPIGKQLQWLKQRL